MALLHDWDAEKVKYMTLAQACIYITDSKKETQIPSAFKKSIKFKNRAEAIGYLAKKGSKK